MLLYLAWANNPLMTPLLAAAASSTTDDPLLFLLNFGTLGVWVFCNATGIQPTRAEVKRLDAEIARLIEMAARRDEKDRDKDRAVEALVNLMSSRTLPTLATAVAEIPSATQQAASQTTDVAFGKRLEDLVLRVERALGDDEPT